MRYKTFIKGLATTAVSVLFCLMVAFTPMVVHASDKAVAAEVSEVVEEKTESKDSNESTVTDEGPVVIMDNKVPLGLDTFEDFEQYKRDAFVIIVFGGMIVLLTVLATVKKKNDKERFN